MMKKKKGSILILVLWTLGLLSVFALYLGLGVRQRLDFLKRVETRNKLYHIALSGVKQAIAQIGNLQEEQGFIALNDEWSSNESLFSHIPIGEGNFTVGYNYRIGDFQAEDSPGSQEGMFYGMADLQGKLNINKASHDELMRLIEYVAETDQQTADKIASAIIDWRDEDNKSLPQGAEGSYYRGLNLSYDCKDAPIESLQELAYIKGMEYAIFMKLKPYITVYGTGTVNINTARGPTLYALGLSKEVVKKILLYRCGEDQIIGNKDDRIFTYANSVVAKVSQVYSMSPSEIAQFSNVVSAGRISVFSQLFQIESVAIVNNSNEKCRIECIIKINPENNSAKAGQILSFKTNYLI